jgi:hypothetical protein
MKNSLLIAVFLIIGIKALPQRYLELGVFGGVSYYTGDLNPNAYFPLENTHMALGLAGRYNFNSRWAMRFNLTHGNISGNDGNSSDPFQQNRNLSFYSSINEASAVMEFNFLYFDPYNPMSYFKGPDKFTPFIYGGLSVFNFNPKARIGQNEYELRAYTTELEEYSRTSIAIPFGGGFKFRLSDRLIVTTEWGMRKTFTDYLDDVSGMYPDSPQQLSETGADLSDRSVKQQGKDGSNWGTQRGNSQTTDWFSFAGITLTYNIHKNPNHCHFNQWKSR